jgi:hypothetical protein
MQPRKRQKKNNFPGAVILTTNDGEKRTIQPSQLATITIPIDNVAGELTIIEKYVVTRKS